MIIVEREEEEDDDGVLVMLVVEEEGIYTSYVDFREGRVVIESLTLGS